MVKLVTALVLAVGCLLFGRMASASPTPSSVAFIDFTVDGARLEQDVPLEELARVLHRPVPQEAVAGDEELRAYAELRLHAGPWSVELVDVVGHPSADGPRARFRFVLHELLGDTSPSIVLRDDIVADEILSHYTMVYVRSDWAAGILSEKPRFAGTIHGGKTELTIARNGGFMRGLGSAIALGAEHIATGTDHLLFLCALVLVAPLAAAGGRWRERRGTRETLIAIARIVSAFTIGHSLTLAFGALQIASPSPAVVEVAIAASVLVAAVHAFRPLFPRREALVAVGFGLVHGLAFASSLPARDLGRAEALWTVLGFNAGIELAQLALLLLVAPWLLHLSRTGRYERFRVAGAAIIAFLALTWILERTTGITNPTTRPLAWLTASPLPLLVALALGTTMLIAQRPSLRTRATTPR